MSTDGDPMPGQNPAEQTITAASDLPEGGTAQLAATTPSEGAGAAGAEAAIAAQLTGGDGTAQSLLDATRQSTGGSSPSDVLNEADAAYKASSDRTTAASAEGGGNLGDTIGGAHQQARDISRSVAEPVGRVAGQLTEAAVRAATHAATRFVVEPPLIAGKVAWEHALKPAAEGLGNASTAIGGVIGKEWDTVKRDTAEIFEGLGDTPVGKIAIGTVDAIGGVARWSGGRLQAIQDGARTFGADLRATTEMVATLAAAIPAWKAHRRAERSEGLVTQRERQLQAAIDALNAAKAQRDTNQQMLSSHQSGIALHLSKVADAADRTPSRPRPADAPAVPTASSGPGSASR